MLNVSSLRCKISLKEDLYYMAEENVIDCIGIEGGMSHKNMSFVHLYCPGTSFPHRWLI